MKRIKTVLVLLVICGVAACQSYIDFRKPMRLLYGGDTLIISLQGDSVIFSGEAAELVLRDSTLLEIIQAHGGGGVTPTDNILQWDAVNNYYKPYASAPVGLGFYNTSSQIPSSYKGDMGFNGSLFAYRVEAHQVIASSDNDDTYAGRFTQTINSPGVLIQQSGNTALFSTRSTLRLERSVSGSSNIQSNIIDIVDNPTTSGQIIGSVLKAEIASTLRVNLNPRAENLGLSTAYLFDTHNNLTVANTKLMSIKNQGVEKFFIDKDGYVSGAKYYVSALNTAPSSATDTGTTGEIRVTATHIYVCTATNTWVRTALTTW